MTQRIEKASASFHAGNLARNSSKSLLFNVQVRVISSRLPASASFFHFGEKIMEAPR